MTESLALQREFWTAWNAANRERGLSEISLDQMETAVAWLKSAGRTDLSIIDVGCGAGWMCPPLQMFGRVTATDLSEDVLARAAERIPSVRFVPGDFMSLDFPESAFDVVVSLEMLSHVADHEAFVAKLARLLRPGGALILATQNRPVLEKYNKIPPPAPGQLRRWFDRAELTALLAPHFDIEELKRTTPIASKGLMRLLAGRRIRGAIRRIAGRSYERGLAGAGLGWTLMVLARKRVS